MIRPDLARLSPITAALERLFYYLQYLSPANVLFRTRVQSQSQFPDPNLPIAETIRRARLIELYISVWALLEVTAVLVVPRLVTAAQLFVVAMIWLRVFDITQSALNLNVFDRLRIVESSQFVASLARTAILSVWNFFELAICFGVIYSSTFAHLSRHESGDAYYFSIVTQLTVGYGDVQPLHGTRFLAMAQSSLGFVLAIFAVSRIIAFLPRTSSVLKDD